MFKDFYAISFYDAQHVPWTDNGCLLHHLSGRLSGSQKERYGHSIGIFTGGLVVSWELVIRDHSCDRLLMMLPVVWLAQWGTKAS